MKTLFPVVRRFLPVLPEMVVLANGGIVRKNQQRKTGLVCQIGIVVVRAAVPVFFTENAHFVDHFLRNISDVAVRSLTGLEPHSPQVGQSILSPPWS